jgi:epsilon-lactone hydrolase
MFRRTASAVTKSLAGESPMARFKYIVLSRAQPDREEEFVTWYRDQHLGDVARMPGVVSVELVRLDFQRVYDLDAPQWTLLTQYVLEGDNPETIIDSIRAASGSDAMPMSDALTKAGMVQAAGHVIAEIG